MLMYFVVVKFILEFKTQFKNKTKQLFDFYEIRLIHKNIGPSEAVLEAFQDKGGDISYNKKSRRKNFFNTS